MKRKSSYIIIDERGKPPEAKKHARCPCKIWDITITREQYETGKLLMMATKPSMFTTPELKGVH